MNLSKYQKPFIQTCNRMNGFFISILIIQPAYDKNIAAYAEKNTGLEKIIHSLYL